MSISFVLQVLWWIPLKCNTVVVVKNNITGFVCKKAIHLICHMCVSGHYFICWLFLVTFCLMVYLSEPSCFAVSLSCLLSERLSGLNVSSAVGVLIPWEYHMFLYDKSLSTAPTRSVIINSNKSFLFLYKSHRFYSLIYQPTFNNTIFVEYFCIPWLDTFWH
jgi:hypothetical protein